MNAAMQAQEDAEMEGDLTAQMEYNHVEVEDISSSAPQSSQGNLRRSNRLAALFGL